MRTRQQIGREAEDLAADYLASQGLRLLERNYRCRGGEIDLILSDGRQLVFVEVRYRSNSSFGTALDTVDHRKQQRLILAAQHYLQRQSNTPSCRFDVVGIGAEKVPVWIKDAFHA